MLLRKHRCASQLSSIVEIVNLSIAFSNIRPTERSFLTLPLPSIPPPPLYPPSPRTLSELYIANAFFSFPFNYPIVIICPSPLTITTIFANRCKDAIIYVVDSMDRDRIGISKTELLTMLEEDELKKAILVVFANKQDLEGCLSVTEVANALGLATLKNRKYQIFKTSATKGEGLDEAMEWLSNAILQQK